MTCVYVRRHWSDSGRVGKVQASDLTGLHWSYDSGGIGVVSPRPFLHGYIYCDQVIEGEVAHSCQHGPGPHRIKVCVVQKDNTKAVYRSLLARP